LIFSKLGVLQKSFTMLQIHFIYKNDTLWGKTREFGRLLVQYGDYLQCVEEKL